MSSKHKHKHRKAGPWAVMLGRLRYRLGLAR